MEPHGYKGCGPKRAWIAEHCPKALAAIEVTVRQPAIALVWARNLT